MFHSYKVLIIITISFIALSLGGLKPSKEDAIDKNEWLFGIQNSKQLYIFIFFYFQILNTFLVKITLRSLQISTVELGDKELFGQPKMVP